MLVDIEWSGALLRCHQAALASCGSRQNCASHTASRYHMYMLSWYDSFSVYLSGVGLPSDGKSGGVFTDHVLRAHLAV